MTQLVLAFMLSWAVGIYGVYVIGVKKAGVTLLPADTPVPERRYA